MLFSFGAKFAVIIINSSSILVHPSCRGEAKNVMKTFVDGTNVAMKDNIDQHLKGKVHEIALSAKKDNPTVERMNLP